MSGIRTLLTSAIDRGDIPFGVAMATSRETTFASGAAGQARAGLAASETTLFRAFSMSKAVCAFAVLQLMERGRVTLDTPVSDILPAWQELQVLHGFAADGPILKPQTQVATLRHLLTHTSGLAYEFWNADVANYLEVTGHPGILSGLKAALNYPLIAEPGQGWAYGISTDWLGQVVAAVDGRAIDTYCVQEIFGPLGLRDTLFEPDSARDRLCDLSIRDDTGALVPFALDPPAQPEFYGLGHALFTTPADYLRFLRMILNEGSLDGERLASAQSLQLFLADQMQGQTVTPMYTTVPGLAADVILQQQSTHSMLGVICNQTQPGLRASGSQGWAGACNTHYWIDPKRDVAAVFMTQSLPFYDPRVMACLADCERAIYAARA